MIIRPWLNGLASREHILTYFERYLIYDFSLASTVFHTFVASDDASETFAGLKRIHGLMPYFMLKAALKITNPVSMIRSTLLS